MFVFKTFCLFCGHHCVRVVLFMVFVDVMGLLTGIYYDYVVDCIDTVVAKMELAKRCHALKIPFISSMGAANKMDAAAFRVADISKTKIDPLAKVLRKKLRAQGIRHFKVVYSEEEPLKPLITGSLTDYLPAGSSRRSVPASNAFVPPSAGLLIAGEVVKDLLEKAGTFRE